MEVKEFIDYYAEFEIERTADCSEIRNILGSLEADYLQQRAVCITSSQMEVIQNLLDIIGNAIYYLTNEDRRKKYDKKLEMLAKSGELNQQQTRANSDYERAQLYEARGKAKEAIIFAERAIAQNIYNKDTYELMIRCCYQVGDYQKALDVAENKAIRMYPDEVIFSQYSARIHTLQGDYDSALNHIQNMMTKYSDNTAGYIEQAVMYLYMSEDEHFPDSQRKQYRSDAEAEINRYLNEHSDDEHYRSSVATALIGLSECHYSSYQGVTCKIIATKDDYKSIHSLHEWAGEISSDANIQSAVNAVRQQGRLKYNSDNTQSLVCLVLFTILSFAYMMPEFIAFFLIPMILLIKVSLRPLWMIDRIRYTGHVDLLERIMVVYGKFAIKLVEWSWEFTKFLIKFVIGIASGI